MILVRVLPLSLCNKPPLTCHSRGMIFLYEQTRLAASFLIFKFRILEESRALCSASLLVLLVFCQDTSCPMDIRRLSSLFILTLRRKRQSLMILLLVQAQTKDKLHWEAGKSATCSFIVRGSASHSKIPNIPLPTLAPSDLAFTTSRQVL